MEKATRWLQSNPEKAAARLNGTAPGNAHPNLLTELNPPFLTPRHLKIFVDDSLIAALSQVKNLFME